eukprot:COSAG04_NODE_26233_length_297_cov_1.186869_1_plen_74_part_01
MVSYVLRLYEIFPPLSLPACKVAALTKTARAQRCLSRPLGFTATWVKQRNLGQKNETLARKTGFSALPLSVSVE